MVEVFRLGPCNPSSQHRWGRESRRVLDQALCEVATLLGSDISRTGSSQLVLTSGGTEANHLALHGLAPLETPRWISAIEHPSLLAPALALQKQGYPVRLLPVDSQGRVLLDQLAEQLKSKALPGGLVSVMAANNETGVIQPLADIAAICHEFGALFHTDATQWIGKLPIDFQRLKIDALTFTPHKFHGPVGVGGLLLAPTVKLQPLWHGGQQQLGLRPGTEPVALAVGMATALRIATQTLPQMTAQVGSLRNRFEELLQNNVPSCVIHSQEADRIPTTTSVSFPGIDRQALLLRLDIDGIACSTGSACTSGSSEPSHVLAAMGVPAPLIDSAVRFGLSKLSTLSDVELATQRISLAINKLRFQ